MHTKAIAGDTGLLQLSAAIDSVFNQKLLSGISTNTGAINSHDPLPLEKYLISSGTPVFYLI